MTALIHWREVSFGEWQPRYIAGDYMPGTNPLQARRRTSKKKAGLSQDEWTVLRLRVMTRDLAQAWMKQPAGTPWTWTRNGNACVAAFLDSQAGPCDGHLTLDHVKCQPKLGEKAPDNERHLVTLCRRHHLDTVAGANWATSHRDQERTYLEDLYGRCEGDHREDRTP